MPFALQLLPEGPNYRKPVFDAGLERAGYMPVDGGAPAPEDIVVMWNRHPRHEPLAREYERAGARVVVVENGYLGKTWIGKKWFAISVGHHNGAGQWRDGGAARWDSWGVEMSPPRAPGGETVILGQRGIGEPGLASPVNWEHRAQARYGGRIRAHPGAGADSGDLLYDLRTASRVITWGSGAAVLAKLAGIEVINEFPQWIGAGDDGLATFRRLAWAMWTAEEVESGEAFRWLLH